MTATTSPVSVDLVTIGERFLRHLATTADNETIGFLLEHPEGLSQDLIHWIRDDEIVGHFETFEDALYSEHPLIEAIGDHVFKLIYSLTNCQVDAYRAEATLVT